MPALLPRRLFCPVLLAAACLAACSSDGPPTAGSVRTVVVAHLLDLKRRYVAGDYQGMPPNVADMDEAERDRIRRLIARAEIVSFSSDGFYRREDGNWIGHVTFEVTVPVPDAPSFVVSHWRANAQAVLERRAYTWSALGLLDLTVEREAGNLERT